MSTSTLFILFSSIFIFNIASLSVAQPDFLYHFCLDDDGNFTSNSTYQSNLDRLLPSLAPNASIDGFFSSSVGQNPNRVSAMSLCRGDTLPEACRSCVNDSVHKLPQLCPFRKGAIGWYDNCLLEFSNQSITAGTAETSPGFYMKSPNNISSTVNITQFNQVLGDLMYGLRMTAAAGGSILKFATGEMNVTSFRRIFGLMQCTPDLSELSCSNCLESATSQIPICCNELDGGRVVRPSCNLRYESYRFYEAERNGAPPPAAANSPPPTSSFIPPSLTNSSTNTTENGNNTTRTVIIVVVPTVSVMLVVLICFVLRRRKPWKKLDVESVDDIRSVESLHFDFGTIRAATDNFSLANKLGQGGFGPVYKGRLSNGEEIAVKRLSMDSGQGDLEFKNEVLLVARLQHRNLVRLLGFSLQGDERLLIYEFVPNTSLNHFLFDPVRCSQLDWERRYKIIGGIARGLLYLHEDSRLRIIHRDLKASNILLDADMSPKISDFGMARLFVMDQTQGNTSRIVGTYGYMAPEYAMHGQFSVKSDVFSFGVLVLEIVSGKKNNCFLNGEDLEDLITYAWKNWREGTALNLMDPTLSNGARREIMRCIHIGLLCVQENVVNRPTMASVLLMLDSNSLTLPVPSQPAFFMHSSVEQSSLPFQDDSGMTDSNQSKSKSDEYSVNEETITESEVYPR